MEVLLNKLFDKHSEGYGVYDRENLIKDICKELQNLQLQQTGVSGSLFSDDDINQYFSYGYGGDKGSAIYGAKWAKNNIIQEISRRINIIISERNEIVKEQMIYNILVCLQ